MGKSGNLNSIKPEIRIIGVDDGPFEKAQKQVFVVGVVFRGKDSLDGLVSCFVKKDGLDSTERISDMINKTRHKDQLRVIMLDGIALAGFNLIDIKELSKRTGLAVVIVIRRMPNLEKIDNALKRFDDYIERKRIIDSAGEIFQTKDRKTFFQCAGVSREKAEEIIVSTRKRGNLPEPIRVSHIIASGIVLGESHGRA